MPYWFHKTLVRYRSNIAKYFISFYPFILNVIIKSTPNYLIWLRKEIENKKDQGFLQL